MVQRALTNTKSEKNYQHKEYNIINYNKQYLWFVFKLLSSLSLRVSKLRTTLETEKRDRFYTNTLSYQNYV